MKAVDHATATGFWCEFCRDYHETVTCPHPANDGSLDDDDRLDNSENLADELFDANEKIEQLEDKLERLDTLAFEWDDTHPKRAKELRAILDT